MPGRPLPARDLQNVLTLARSSFEELRGARIFVTGGTGFFGHWLLESLLHANAELKLDVHATVFTRDASRFRERSPHIASSPAITLLAGDVRSFEFPAEPHSHVVHAAADSTVAADATELGESIVEGTRRVLQFARSTGARRLLYVSSGAVYGRGVSGIIHIPETYSASPAPLASTSGYDEAKRTAEHLTIAHAQGTRLEPVIARCFAFVGPHLPLDAHFAVGNFIRDALAGSAIEIQGDGTPLRSYLYMSDLAAWLWIMLVRGVAGRAYNVGSDEAVSIRELAQIVACTLRPELPVHVACEPQPGAKPVTYVPDISRAMTELGLGVTVSLADAIRRTAEWHFGQVTT